MFEKKELKTIFWHELLHDNIKFKTKFICNEYNCYNNVEDLYKENYNIIESYINYFNFIDITDLEKFWGFWDYKIKKIIREKIWNVNRLFRDVNNKNNKFNVSELINSAKYKIFNVLKDLDENLRQIFILTYIIGFNEVECLEILSLSKKEYRNRLNESLNRIYNKIQEENGVENGEENDK